MPDRRPYNGFMAKSKRNKTSDNTIAQNKRARFDYHLLESFEAGVSLAGWEVKALRAGKAELTDSYVLMKDGEAFLLGANIAPLETVSTHFVTDPTRTRKLLLHKKELAKINAGVTQKARPVSAQRSTGKDIWSRPASNSLRAKSNTTNARAKKIATGSGKSTHRAR
ncbi:MAG: hypothetical protein CM15mP25_4280 [Gammaproteobacteria bacterium]|nr:MAG: hypothetical protein CM15mP25_4280 [Gammaproteobacteria bacterium]